MAPPLAPFSPQDLPDRVQITEKGKLKKKHVDLKACDFKVLDQHVCNIDQDPQSPTHKLVLCEAVERMFRQCRDGLTVETTAWKGEDGRVQKLA